MNSRWFDGLNPEQRLAVSTVEGPVLVLAGAGSGKTRVITHRIAHLIDLGVDPKNILAVTFTNKAAAEMRKRLKVMIGKPASLVTLSTFHALGLMMLRKEAQGQRFTIFDTGDQHACLRELTHRIRLEKSLDLGAIIGRISAWKNAFVQPDKVEVGDDPYDQAAAILYPAYQEALAGFAAVDFDDLICKPTILMENDQNCRERWEKQFHYVLVDEYQDTNTAQLRMLFAICKKHRNLCVVGDDDQSIYAWRGAQVRNILRFGDDFGGCTKVHLMCNYRSVNRVLALANEVIRANPIRHPKQLKAVRGEGLPIRLVVLEDGDTEANWIADQIETQIRQGRKPDQIAVLYRSNKLARGLESALRTKRLAYRLVGGKSFFDRKEVRDLIAYLRLCLNARDDISFRRVINFPPRGIGLKTLERLVAWTQQNQRSLLVAASQASQFLSDNDRAHEPLVQFSGLIQRMRQVLIGQGQLVAGLRELIETIGLKKRLLDTCATPKAFEHRWALVTDFVNSVEAYTKNTPKPSLSEFMTRLQLAEMEIAAEDTSAEKVTLSTLHGAKGLEFESVFLCGLEEGLLPHDRVMNPHATEAVGSDLAEERRLFYVGITRAKDELILTRAEQREVHGRIRPRAQTRFLSDIKEGLIEIEDKVAPLSTTDAKSRLAEIKALLD